MSYDISFRVRVEDSDNWVDVGSCEANTTWNLREMIVKSTGLEWNNEADNGLCKDVIPHIINGYRELCEHPDNYKKYESSNGWGTLPGCKKFFLDIINSWEEFTTSYETADLTDYAHFWII